MLHQISHVKETVGVVELTRRNIPLEDHIKGLADKLTDGPDSNKSQQSLFEPVLGSESALTLRNMDKAPWYSGGEQALIVRISNQQTPQDHQQYVKSTTLLTCDTKAEGEENQVGCKNTS